MKAKMIAEAIDRSRREVTAKRDKAIHPVQYMYHEGQRVALAEAQAFAEKVLELPE